MKIAARRVYVVECPRCKRPIDWSGEGAIYFRSKKLLSEQVELWRGTADSGTSLTEYCGCRSRTARARDCARCGACKDADPHHGCSCHTSSPNRKIPKGAP